MGSQSQGCGSPHSAHRVSSPGAGVLRSTGAWTPPRPPSAGPPPAGLGSSSRLAGAPQTWIGVGSADLFCDEDSAYARALKDAGVDLELVVVDGAFHAFEVVAPKAQVSRTFIDAYLANIKRAIGCSLAEAQEPAAAQAPLV